MMAFDGPQTCKRGNRLSSRSVEKLTSLLLGWCSLEPAQRPLQGIDVTYNDASAPQGALGNACVASAQLLFEPTLLPGGVGTGLPRGSPLGISMPKAFHSGLRMRRAEP